MQGAVRSFIGVFVERVDRIQVSFTGPFRKRSEILEQPEDGERDVSIGPIGTKPCGRVHFVKKDGFGVSLRYGYIDILPPSTGGRLIQVLHARWTLTITGGSVERLHADLEVDTARVVRESNDRPRQGEEG